MTTFADEQLSIEEQVFGPRDAMNAALAWSKADQEADGRWVGVLESNSCMEAQYILGMHVLGVTDDPKHEGIVQCIKNEQREDGSWGIYYGAPNGDVNTTVECFAALRCAGESLENETVKKALAWIHEHDAMNKLRVFTKIWLAMIGEWPWKETPSLPAELIYLPPWAPLSLYKFSSWARATIVPLCILRDEMPVVPLPEDRRLDQLFPDGREKFDYRLVKKADKDPVKRFFQIADRLVNKYNDWAFKPGREAAKRHCLEWIIRHQDADGCWGGIQPPWMNSILALRYSGYPMNHPVIQKGLKCWDTQWSYERNGGTYIQASESPIWDTLLTMLAYQDCDRNLENSPELYTALEYILGQQVTDYYGDWALTVKGVKPGGWAFESENDSYPDVDDTAVALIVLAELRDQLSGMDRERVDFAIERAVDWVIAMQSDNGGWGAFDKNNQSALVGKIPFSDFGECLDPPSVDLAGHVLEAFGKLGMSIEHPTIQKALDYIKSEQEEEGCWFGRWGVNYIYGTAAVLPALEALKMDMNEPWVRKAADWIVSVQNEDGGWGESCQSYMDKAMWGKGESTASQTGWALMSLLAMDSRDYLPAIERGVAWLTETQVNGTWNEEQYTGTGFPGYGLGERTDVSDSKNHLDQGKELSRGFMINYNLYRHYFPLMALGRYQRLLKTKA